MVDVFTPELTFGPYQSGIMTPTSPGLPYRTIQGGFNPTSLFAGGKQGAWWDFSDSANLFQDAAGTTPAVLTQPLGRVNDKSGNGNNITQAGAARPTWITSSGFLMGDFDGIDDAMASAAGNLSSSPLLVIFAAITLDTTTTGVIVGNQAAVGAAAGGFRTNFNTGLGANAPQQAVLWDGVTTSDYFESAPIATPKTCVITVQLDYSQGVGNEISIRRNGVAQALTASSAGPVATTNFANSFFNVGQSGGALFFDGKIYQLALLSGGATASQISQMEAYMAAKCGVTLP